MRLVVYALIVGAAIVTGSGLGPGNDEPLAAHLWGMPSLTLVGALAVPFGVLAWRVARRLTGTALHVGLQLAVLSLTMLGVGLQVGNVIDPWPYPDA